MEPVSDALLFSQLPAGAAVFRLSPEGTYTALCVNGEIAEKFGAGGEEIARALGADPAALFHPDDGGRVALMLYKGSVTGGRFAETARVRRRGGGYVWTDIRMNAVPEEGGACLLLFLLQDVGEQREAGLKLERTYERLLSVMDHTPGGVLVFDTKNDREPYPVYVSPGMYRMLGAGPEEAAVIYGRNYLAAVHQDDRENVIRALEESIRTLAPFQLTVRLLAGGRTIWADVSGTAAASEGRRSLYVTVTDFSAGRETQRLLQRVLDLLVRRQYEMIALLDAEGRACRVLSADRKHAERLPGETFPYRPELEKALETYAAPEERARLLQALRPEALRRALARQDELELFFTAGSGENARDKKLWICRLDEDGRLALVLSDCTQAHRQQREHQEALTAALRAAEQANVAKSAFLSRMSHDIRTPLNAILGFTQMSLADPDTGGAGRERLEKIDSASRYLLSLVNDVLDMSRIESGKYILKQERFETADLLGEVDAMIAAQCQGKGLVYRSEIAESVRPAYTGDRLKLQQVLINILGNAVKFTPSGGRVTLRAEETFAYARGAMLRFRIRDTGVGISESFLPHLFETFTQEDPSGVSQTGTGLGLAISRSIVTMMNGTIRVKSEKGAGTEFTVLVQLGLPESAPEDEKRPAGDEPQPAVWDFSGRRILLAEDNRMNQEIAVYLLEKMGFAVDTAENGQLACERFAASEPGAYSAVLLDIRMPVMDGLEAARTIRALNRSDAARVPLIALSADAFEEDISKSLANGINAHLIKPIDPDALRRTLSGLIGRAEQGPTDA